MGVLVGAALIFLLAIDISIRLELLGHVYRGGVRTLLRRGRRTRRIGIDPDGVVAPEFTGYRVVVYQIRETGSRLCSRGAR